MNFKSAVKYIISIIFLTNSLSAIASNQQVLCPEVNLIKNKWSYLDTVQVIEEKKFLVYSGGDSIFDEGSKLWWQIASEVTATDFNNALFVAQNNIKNINTPKDKYALETGGVFYICSYLDSTGTVTSFASADIPGKGTKIKNAILSTLHN